MIQEWWVTRGEEGVLFLGVRLWLPGARKCDKGMVTRVFCELDWMVTRSELLFSKGESVSGCFAVLHLNLVIRVIGDDDNDEKFAFQIEIRDELNYHFWLCLSLCMSHNQSCLWCEAKCENRPVLA